MILYKNVLYKTLYLIKYCVCYLTSFVFLSFSVSTQSVASKKKEFVPELNNKANVINLTKTKSLFPNTRYAKLSSKLYEMFSSEIDEKTLPYVLEYSDGSRFLVEKSIGKGTVSYVFKVQNLDTKQHTALRIPQKLELAPVFNYWASYHKEFRLSHYPVPKMHNWKEGQFIEAELLDIKFTLQEFLELPASYPKKEANDALKKLDEFYKSTQNFASFKDNKPANIAFDGNKWFALDWTSGPTRYDIPGENRGGLFLNRFFRFQRDNSYKRYLKMKDGELLHFPFKKKVLNLITKYENKHYDKLALTFYKEIPESYRDKNFYEQLKYVKSINDHSPVMNRMASELLLKTRTTKEFFQILETLDLKLDTMASNFFFTQWKNLEGNTKIENDEKIKQVIKKYFSPNEVDRLLGELSLLQIKNNCTINSLLN